MYGNLRKSTTKDDIVYCTKHIVKCQFVLYFMLKQNPQKFHQIVGLSFSLLNSKLNKNSEILLQQTNIAMHHEVLSTTCREASKFQNNISQYHINLISVTLTNKETLQKISRLPVHSTSHGDFSSDFTSLLLHNNSANFWHVASLRHSPPMYLKQRYMLLPQETDSSKKLQI